MGIERNYDIMREEIINRIVNLLNVRKAKEKGMALNLGQ